MLTLLAQVVQRGQHLGTGLVGVHLDVVTDRVCREEPDHPVGGEPLLPDQGVEHFLSVVVQLAGGLAGGRIVEDVGESALHLPGVEERLPVDVLAQLGQVVVMKLAHPETLRGQRRRVASQSIGVRLARAFSSVSIGRSFFCECRSRRAA